MVYLINLRFLIIVVVNILVSEMMTSITQFKISRLFNSKVCSTLLFKKLDQN